MAEIARERERETTTTMHGTTYNVYISIYWQRYIIKKSSYGWCAAIFKGKQLKSSKSIPVFIVYLKWASHGKLTIHAWKKERCYARDCFVLFGIVIHTYISVHATSTQISHWQISHHVTGPISAWSIFLIRRCIFCLPLISPPPPPLLPPSPSSSPSVCN